jgi:hypothetical protein
MGNFAPTPTANRDNKRKRNERQGTGAPAAAMAPAIQQEVQTSSMRGTYGQGTVNKVSNNLQFATFDHDSARPFFYRSSLYYSSLFACEHVTIDEILTRPSARKQDMARSNL